jgi:hypothetical protein
VISSYLSGAVLDWRTWVALTVLVMFPGILLRIFLLVYPRHDPRRAELLAEYYVVPVYRKPLWIIQQIEVIIFEGVPERWYQFAVGRIIYRWKLDSGEKLHAAHPDTFWLPEKDDRQGVPPGFLVKLIFMMRDGWGERMWVRVEGRKREKYVGCLENSPVGIPALGWGDRITFSAANIIDIATQDELDELHENLHQDDDLEAEGPDDVCEHCAVHLDPGEPRVVDHEPLDDVDDDGATTA